MSSYRLEVSDARQFIGSLEPDSVDACISDAPFGILEEEWDNAGCSVTIELMPLLYRAMKPHAWGIIFINCWHVSLIRDAAIAAGFKFVDLIVWKKTSPNLQTPLETAIRFRKKGLNRFEVKPPCMYINQVASRYRNLEIDAGIHHPCRKPVRLMRKIIKDYTNRNDFIVDPFIGSGTTAVAAAIEERFCWGCDVTEEYFVDAAWRLKNYKLYA